MTETERLMCHAIDINGLNLCDRNRIEDVGLNTWGHHPGNWRNISITLTTLTDRLAECYSPFGFETSDWFPTSVSMPHY